MDHRFILPNFRAKKPAINHLLRRETFVVALTIDGFQEIKREGRERTKPVLPDDLFASHFPSLLCIDSLDATRRRSEKEEVKSEK